MTWSSKIAHPRPHCLCQRWKSQCAVISICIIYILQNVLFSKSDIMHFILFHTILSITWMNWKIKKWMLFKTTTFWVVCLTGSLMDMVYYPIGFQMLHCIGCF
jgi:hypothetical protein